jgi:biotin transport system substrate-specific component
VPITFQTLGVMLAGAILGARKGFLSVLLLLALVAAGLPLLSGGRGGLGVFVGPSVGYLIGWLLGVVVIGWCTARLLPRYRVLPALAATALGGIVAVYLVGVPVFAAITATPIDVAFLGSLVFLPGDLVKVVVTVFVAKGVHRAWPGLIAPQPWPWQRTAAVAAAA